MDHKSTIASGKGQSQKMRNHMNPLTNGQCIEKGNCQEIGVRETEMGVNVKCNTRESLCGDGQVCVSCAKA